MPLPDYLTPLDEAEVRARILERLPETYDKNEGEVFWEIAAAVALEIGVFDDRMMFVFDLGFADTTFGEFLDRRADEHGVFRNAATFATGTLELTGTLGTDIPAGTRFTTQGSEAVLPQAFTTDVDVEIGAGPTLVAATAAIAGAAGNAPAETIVLPENPIDGLTAVTNPLAFSGGFDVETDESLLEKLNDKVRNPGTSGNQANYRQWAREVAGVGAATVVPIEDGPGTVTVAILDVDMTAPDAGLVAEVQEYIAPGGLNTGTGKAPVGASVTVEGATEVPIDINADLTVDGGFLEADVQTAAEAAIRDYLATLAFADDNDVRQARIVTAILDTPGALDVTGVEIRRDADPFGVANVAIAQKEVATLGAVVWS